MMTKRASVVLLLLVGLSGFCDISVAKSPAPVVQDEVAELLGEANEAYQKGYYKLASTRMNQALTLVRQLESQRAHRIFPDAMAGWKTSEDGNEALNKFKSMGIGSVFATGLTYTKEQPNNPPMGEGKEEQTVQMILVQKPSSPQPLFDLVLAGLLMPRPGMEKIAIGPYTGHYLCAVSNPTDCDMSIPVESDYVILVNGKGVSRETLLSYAKAIHFDLLETFR